MPKYTFECVKCSNKKTMYTNSNTRSVPCSLCGGLSARLPPNVNKANVTELIDSYSGVHLSPEYKNEMDQRSLDYFWAVEVPRLCGEYPEAECIANGWMAYNEKGELFIQTKPPNRR
jgi:ribosomal protein S27E